MKNTRNVTDSVVWIGANDRRISLFENMLPLDRGVSYNSYLILDEKTAVMDGHEATRTIRALDRRDAGEIPILAMTANAFSEDVEKSLASGMNGHISKPIDLQEVFEKITAALQAEK